MFGFFDWRLAAVFPIAPIEVVDPRCQHLADLRVQPGKLLELGLGNVFLAMRAIELGARFVGISEVAPPSFTASTTVNLGSQISSRIAAQELEKLHRSRSKKLFRFSAHARTQSDSGRPGTRGLDAKVVQQQAIESARFRASAKWPAFVHRKGHRIEAIAKRAAAKTAAIRAIPAERLTLRREERIKKKQFNPALCHRRGRSGTGSPRPARVSWGPTMVASATIAVACLPGRMRPSSILDEAARDGR